MNLWGGCSCSGCRVILVTCPTGVCCVLRHKATCKWCVIETMERGSCLSESCFVQEGISEPCWTFLSSVFPSLVPLSLSCLTFTLSSWKLSAAAFRLRCCDSMLKCAAINADHVSAGTAEPETLRSLSAKQPISPPPRSLLPAHRGHVTRAAVCLLHWISCCD